MKALFSKINPGDASHASRSFFEKKGEKGFFSRSSNSGTPFFPLQTKLIVGAAGDQFEQEADAVAERVSQNLDASDRVFAGQTQSLGVERAGTHYGGTGEMPVHRKPAFESEENTGAEVIRRKGAGQVTGDVETQLQDSKGRGKPLDPDARMNMEQNFGASFEDVRIHHDSAAAEMNQQLGARAFTTGRDIYFNQGNYNPGTVEGDRLLAHELTHVIQQHGGQSHAQGQRISRAPERRIQRAIQDVRQAELMTFFSQPEGMIPQELLDKYLVEPSLMATQRNIIRTLVDHVQNAEAPFTTTQFQSLVQGSEGDLGTALIICHNITKALARGQSPINWSNESRDPLVYSLNGTRYTFDPESFHRDAYSYSSRGENSVFYAMFSGDELGMRDEGDWYHFFALAATSYYQASGNFQPGGSRQADPMTELTGGAVRGVVEALRDPGLSGSAYEGWLLANAISFLEGGVYGGSQEEVVAESEIHMKGASAGLAAQGRIPEDNWVWYIPATGSIQFQDLSHFRLRSDMISVVRSGIVGEFDLTIIRGTTPNHWYDTPDSFVRIPGFLGGPRTPTQVDNTSPEWNHLLTTLSYGDLSGVTLHLIDEDPLVNDPITTFTEDLLPEGQRSREFQLSSGGSTLEVRVEANGHIMLGNP